MELELKEESNQMFSNMRSLLESVPSTGRDKVVSLEPSDPHAPPRVLPTLYRQASEQNAYVIKLEADLAAFEAAASDEVAAMSKAMADRETMIRAERTQRLSAIMHAKRQLDEMHGRWVNLSSNIGLNITTTPDEGEPT